MTCVTNLNAMLNTACKAQVVARMCGNVCEMFEIEHKPQDAVLGLRASWTPSIEGDVLHSVLQKFQVHLDEDFNGNCSLPDNFS